MLRPAGRPIVPDIWDRVSRQSSLQRGFDFDGAGLSHLALEAVRDLRTQPGGPPLVEDDCRGSFAAICELAGWWRWHMPCDPDDASARQAMAGAADELMRMAFEIRRALRNDEETT